MGIETKLKLSPYDVPTLLVRRFDLKQSLFILVFISMLLYRERIIIYVCLHKRLSLNRRGANCSAVCRVSLVLQTSGNMESLIPRTVVASKAAKMSMQSLFIHLQPVINVSPLHTVALNWSKISSILKRIFHLSMRYLPV